VTRLSSRILKSEKAWVRKSRWLLSFEDSAAMVARPEQVLDEARRRAEIMLQEAVDAADRISEQAQHKGFAEGRAAGYQAGVDEASALKAKAEAELRLAEQQKHQAINQAEAEIAKLALAVAETILKREISQEPETVVRLVKDAIARIRDEQKVAVRVNPVDAVVIRAHQDELLNGSSIRQLDIEEDASMQRADCVVFTSRGEIDERVESQLSRMASALQRVAEDDADI